MNYAQLAFQYNDTTEQSQILFDQRSMRNEFADSQVLLSEQAAHELVHHGQAYDSPLARNALDGGGAGIGLNQFLERDQMQTAIILQTGSGSGDSNEQSSSLTVNEHEYPDQEQYSSVRRETPAFKNKYKQREASAKATEIRGGAGISGERDGERECLHSVVVDLAQQSRCSRQEQSRQSRRSPQSQLLEHVIVEEIQSPLNFENQFGITQTAEQQSDKPSELEATDYDKDVKQSPT